MSYRIIGRCVACDSADLSVYMDLGRQPLANSYHDGREPQQTYPLAVNVCGSCFHSQLSVAVEPDLLYKNYLYVSGTTKTLIDYFDWFVDWTEQQFGGKKLRVLDIACNDGSLLSRFLAKGHVVKGVDPAENLAPLAREKGVDITTAYWSADTARALGRQFDVITAMNVVAHLPTPSDFLTGCAISLAPGGRVFVQTSQAEMIGRREFDTVYHEHHSFFHTRSMKGLVERAGLAMVAARKVPVHGTSYVWTMQHPLAEAEPSVAEFQADEERRGYYDPQTYTSYMDSIRKTAEQTRVTIADYRRKGFKIFGYGAAAKGNTFLNYAELDLDLIIDDNPLKVGLLTPGRNIPIASAEALASEQKPLLMLVLAWNFFDEVCHRVRQKRANPDDRFITYYPEFRITQ